MKIHYMIGVKNLLQQAPLCCLLYLTSLYDYSFELVSINDV